MKLLLISLFCVITISCASKPNKVTAENEFDNQDFKVLFEDADSEPVRKKSITRKPRKGKEILWLRRCLKLRRIS